MSDPRLISPMLDNFMMGGPISEHHGVCCCPAMENDTNDRYIVKVISVPASPAQMDALLLSGAYSDEASALNYYRDIANEIIKEIDTLDKLSELEWFIPFKSYQMEPMESGKGYEIYLLGEYKRTLQKHFKRHSFTHLDALNLGLDICSALSMCRRNGYLYVDLKPSNIFVTDQRLFRIGDLGFVRLDSLKFASLPEKYQSIYTAPEVRDAFSALNTTMDIYAAGLVLYQAYNNGELPFNDDIHPGDTLPAPLYADYEIGEIILKACAANPDDRWQDPIDMRQAIINYMQRNGAMDTPIVPMPSQEASISEEAKENVDTSTADEESDTQDTANTEDTVESSVEENEIIDIPEQDQDTDTETVEETVANDDLTLVENPNDSEEEIEEITADYDEVTEEVSEILNQADELAAMDVPEPVIVPEHVDLPEVEQIVEDPVETAEAEEISLDEEETSEEVYEDTDFNEEIDNISLEESPIKRIHWVRNAIIVFAVIALLVCGFYFYKNHYLLPIEYIAVEGNKDTLTVFVTSDIDDSMLEVICSDTYGNKMLAPVINGKAEFAGLVPNTAYKVKVTAKGFHRLTGSASTAYSTPIQTNIVQFDAITGSTEDSVILSFTAEGPSSNEWSVQYSAEGEEPRSATFVDSQMVTITNLTVGKEYTFQLIPKEALYVTGQTQITFTPRPLVRAQNLQVTSCIDNSLTVIWSVPEGQEISGWSVRCHNDNYSKTITTTDMTVTFDELDHTAEYEIEIKAIGMSVGEKINVPANSVTVTDFNVDTTDPTKFVLSWNSSHPVPEDGWILSYSVVGLGNQETIICKENKAVIHSLIPNSTYRIHLEDIKGTVLLGSQKELTTGDAVEFQKDFGKFTLSRQDLTFYMCRTPARPNWGRYDLSDDDYTTTFTVGQSASFLVRAKKDCYRADESVTTMFIVRNQAGAPIATSHVTKIWTDMWQSYNCKLEIPTMPTETGTYTIDVYFDGGLVHQQQFTIQ